MSDLIGNPNCWFSHAQAQVIYALLQDLGVTKVGHLKRIQQGIKELVNRMAQVDKYSTTSY